MKTRKRAAPAAAEGRLPVRVYKLGGPALEDPELLPPLAEELRRQPGPVVLVHGGGRHVDRLLQALHVESQFIHGRRATSPAAMDVVEMIPTVPDMPFGRATVWLDRSDGLPRRMEIEETSGQKRTLTLHSLRVNQPVSQKTFTFDVPAGVRVVDQG